VIQPHGRQERYTLSVVSLERLTPMLNRLFDEDEFLSPHGIRALSAAYRGGETIELPGREAVEINYKPAESDDRLFGGNSNWRGPIWFPVNSLVLHALRVYAGGFAEELPVDYPVRSNNIGPLSAAADDLEQRLIGLFRTGPGGRRPGERSRRRFLSRLQRGVRTRRVPLLYDHKEVAEVHAAGGQAADDNLQNHFHR